jgi:hypothetical protein
MQETGSGDEQLAELLRKFEQYGMAEFSNDRSFGQLERRVLEVSNELGRRCARSAAEGRCRGARNLERRRDTAALALTSREADHFVEETGPLA